jgi:hypothetical protein
MTWYQKGEEGAEAVKHDEEDRRKSSGAYRLWIPAGGSTQFTFLDSEGFFFKEHNYYANGNWQNWETCIQDIGQEDCPFCEAGLSYYYECVFTIVDHAEYYSKKHEKQMKDVKKLLVLRSTARKKVLRKKDTAAQGDLTYCRFETHRDDKKECSTGEDFELISRQEQAEVFSFAPAEWAGKPVQPADWAKPFDYTTIFKPRTADSLRRILARIGKGGSAPVGSGDTPGLPSSSSEKAPPAPSGEKKGVQSLL